MLAYNLKIFVELSGHRAQLAGSSVQSIMSNRTVSLLRARASFPATKTAIGIVTRKTTATVDTLARHQRNSLATSALVCLPRAQIIRNSKRFLLELTKFRRSTSIRYLRFNSQECHVPSKVPGKHLCQNEKRRDFSHGNQMRLQGLQLLVDTWQEARGRFVLHQYGNAV